MPLAITSASAYFDSLSTAVSKLSADGIEEIAEALLVTYDRGGKVLLFGNGGSASLASHFACDLGKGTSNGRQRKRFRAIALTDNIPMMTAWANDSSYEDIFSEQMINLVEAGDVAFAISGSGNSPNVLKALHTAREAKAVCIGLTGFQGGKMKSICDICFVVPSDNMQIIEDLHLSIAHALFSTIRHQLEHGRIRPKLAANNYSGTF